MSDSEDEPELLKMSKQYVSCGEETALINAFGSTGITSSDCNIETGLNPQIESALARAVCRSLPPDLGLANACPENLNELPHMLLRAVEKQSQNESKFCRQGATKSCILKKDWSGRKLQGNKILTFTATPRSLSNRSLFCPNAIVKPLPVYRSS